MGLFRHRPSLHTWMRAEPGHLCLRIHPPKTGWNPQDGGSQERRWKHCPVILLYLSRPQCAFAPISLELRSHNQADCCLYSRIERTRWKSLTTKRCGSEPSKLIFVTSVSIKDRVTAPFNTSTLKIPTLKSVFRPCEPSRWKESLRIQVFLWLFCSALPCVAHHNRISKGFIMTPHQGGSGSEGYWSVQMAVTTWWGSLKVGSKRENRGRNNKEAHHLHNLPNVFLLSSNSGMGGSPAELRAHLNGVISLLCPQGHTSGRHFMQTRTRTRWQPASSPTVCTL